MSSIMPGVLSGAMLSDSEEPVPVPVNLTPPEIYVVEMAPED